MAESTALEIIISAKDEASKALEGIKGNFKQIAVVAASVGAVITGALGLAVKAAANAEEKMASVNATLATMGKKGLEARDAIVRASEATVQLGFDDEDAAQSIAKLFQRTGDLNEAIRDNQIAMDLARAKHLDLVTASNLVGLVMSGNGRVLKQFGIDLKSAGTPAEALIELQGKLAGQSQAFAQTFGGSSEVLKQEVENLQEKIGEQLLPILIKLLQIITPIIEKTIAWAQAHPELAKVIIIVTAALGALMVVLPVVIGLIVAILSPVGLVTLAVIAIGVAIGILVVLVITHWKQIKQTFQDALDEIKILLTAAGTAFKDGWNAVWNAIKNTIFTVWNGIKAVISDGVNWVIDKINWVINAANKVSSIGSKVGIDIPAIPTIPRLANGGIVMSPTLALIGEAGPEAVVPLNSHGGGIGGINVSVVVNGDVTGEELVEKIGNQLVRILKLSTATV